MLNLIKSASRIQLRTLIGSVMCFCGFGTIAVWTNINIYIFSYFYLLDNEISLKMFNVLSSLTALVAAIMSVFSMRIASYLGFEKLIKISMSLYAVSLIISSYQTNVWLFTVFYSVMLGLAAGMSIIPLLYCLYGHFGEKNTGNITGLTLGFFGLITVYFVSLTTFIINPDK